MASTEPTSRVILASRDTLLTTLETLPDALFVLNDTGTIVYANASAQAMTGVPQKAFLGKSFWRSAPQLVSAALYKAVRNVKRTGVLTEVEYWSPVKEAWLYVHLAPTVSGLTLQFHETRASVRHQETFLSSQLFSMAAQDGWRVGIAVLTPEGVVLEISETPFGDAQIRREEIIGQRLAETPWWSFSPAAQSQLRSAITQASAGERVLFETLLHPGAEMDLDLEGAIIPQVDGDHHVESLVIVWIDVTAHTRADADVGALLDAVPQFIWTGRADGFIDYVNQGWRDYTRMTTEQAQGDGWMQSLHPEDRQRVLEAWQACLQTGQSYETEQRLRDGTTGAYRWFLAKAVPFKDAQGTVLRYVGASTDIEELKRTENALRQSQERASVLMNSSMIGINVIEGEQMVDANDTFLHMTGYTREDLRAGRMNWVDMTPSEYQVRAQLAHQELAVRQSVTYEKEYICKDGSRLPVLVCGVVLTQHPFQGIAFVLDNTARQELERRKDDFLSMASHELKTPLTSLKLQLQLLGKHLTKREISDAAPALSRMEVQVKQLERLIGELLDVSKIQAGRLEYAWETVDLDALLCKVAETTQQMSTTHTIVVRGTPAGSLVADQDRLEQVFTNLLSNAIKYAPDAPLIEVEVSRSTENVTIRVRDQGIGIPREQRKKIFERFYRAFDPSRRAVPGLGMGLYIAAEIIRGHGGTITVDSKVAKGSTFTVTLPLKRAA